MQVNAHVRPRQFGEYLVGYGVVDRYQLFQALQLQDRTRALLGECVAALGFAPIDVIERVFWDYAGGRR